VIVKDFRESEQPGRYGPPEMVGAQRRPLTPDLERAGLSRPLSFWEAVVLVLVPYLMFIAGGVLAVIYARTIQRSLCKLVGKIVGPPLNETDAAGITAAIMFGGIVWLGVGVWLLVKNL
jgi:uncharacterized protein (DUF697 family)